MSDNYQNEVPSACVKIQLDLHTESAQKKVELPLKIVEMQGYILGKDGRPLSEKSKVAIGKNNFDAVSKEFNSQAKIAAPNTFSNDGSDVLIDLDSQLMKDFGSEEVVKKIPFLRSLFAMCNLLRDLKSNLLGNATFFHELGKILKGVGSLFNIFRHSS